MSDYVGIPSRRGRDPVVEAIIENLNVLISVQPAYATQSTIDRAVANISFESGSETGTITSYSEAAPGPVDVGQLVVGDLWFNTSDGYNQHRWNGSDWQDIKDTDINTALTNADDAQATADGRVHTFFQPTTPINGDIPNNADDSNDVIAEGDLWVKTNSVPPNHLFRYDASGVGAWDSLRDGAIDTRIQSFYHVAPEPDPGVVDLNAGDLWYDESNENNIWRFNGALWVDITDTDISLALTNAATAKSIADGKIFTWYKATDPNLTDTMAEGDLWVDTSNGNLLFRWDELVTGDWVQVQDDAINTAQTTGENAQSTADIKAKTFYQDSIPTSTSIGDLWVDTNDGNKLYRAAIVGADAIAVGEWEDSRDETIAVAQTAAEDAEANAQTGITDSGVANDAIADIADDDIMSAVEKSQIVLQVDVINAEQSGIQTEATSYGVSLTAYNAAVTALVTTYLPTLTSPSLWSDVTDETALGVGGGVTLRTRFEDVYTERQIVLDAIAAAAKVLADAAQNAADAKVLTTYATSAPALPDIGDMWVDTDSVPPNKMTFWDGDSWEPIQSQEIVDAYTTAVAAGDIADGKVTTWFQDADPSVAETVSSGDLWIDTNSVPVNKMWRRNAANTGWDDVADGAIQDAQDDADAAYAYAGSKITTFVTGPTPSALVAGDLWMDDTDGYNLYRASAPGVNDWVDIQDVGILTAQQAAEAADALADSKIVTFVGDTAPLAGTIGDLWIDTTGGLNRLHRAEDTADPTTWVDLVDGSIATAQTAAESAQTTANSRNTTYRAAGPNGPTGADEGDLWYESDTGNTPYRYQSDVWVEITDGSIQDAVDLIADKQQKITVETTPEDNAFTAAVWYRYPCDTETIGAFTMTLPLTPTAGDTVYFFDMAGTFDIEHLTVTSSRNILSLNEDLIMDMRYFSGGLQFVNTTIGWTLV
jgi:hypothetical protein